MKIFYEIQGMSECITPCPFNQSCNVGSVACKKCKHCYGHSDDEHARFAMYPIPGKMHNRDNVYVMCDGAYDPIYINKTKRWVIKHIIMPVFAWIETKTFL